MKPQAPGNLPRFRTRERNLRDAALSSLMLAVIFAAIIGAGQLRAFLTKSPAIVLENPDVSHLDVGIPPPDQKLYVYLAFKLHNFGDADGYAHVGLFINGSVHWSRTYLVRFGMVLPVEEAAVIECRPLDSCFDWWQVSVLRLVWTVRALFSS
ncbi:MAG: hypothetical protein E6K00_05675 [Methanobacteriota archaeon]|nr:MAG: hypothetical protein E6K00_05675 [Euryarchaeota archaeon]